MILVVDLGTSYFKASVFDEKATLLSLTAIPTPVTPSHDSRSEIEITDFQKAIRHLLKALAEKLPQRLNTITAITFATQTNSFVLLDAENKPLTPLILWNDQRASGMEEAIKTIASLPGFYVKTGVPELSTEFMPAKLLWLRREQPIMYSRIHRLCLISDYLTLWFTGHHVTEAGAAGLTGMMDIHHLKWWPEVIRQTGLDMKALPEICRAGTDLGCIAPEIAAMFSLPSTCRFITGCLDQYAGAIGSGNVSPGVVSETTGTVLATVACTDTPSITSGNKVFIGPAFEEGRYYRMVFGEVSASLLEAYRNRLSHKPDFTSLIDAAEKTASKAPVPMSEDAQVMLVWIYENIHNYSEGEMTRAIMECVAVALKQQVTTLCGDRAPDQIFCVGGAARSKFWLQLKATLLNRPAVPINCPEPTSLGAALLALHTLSGASLEELAKTVIPYGNPILPN